MRSVVRVIQLRLLLVADVSICGVTPHCGILPLTKLAQHGALQQFLRLSIPDPSTLD